jgi:O-acetyl-ADP-ribose deacetylase (regulator of RNase III)
MDPDNAKRLLGDITALQADVSPPEHDPPPGTVGEFAYSWFTQGANRARKDFAHVAMHVALDSSDLSLTPFAFPYDRTASSRMLRVQSELAEPLYDTMPMSAMSDRVSLWGASLGATRASASPRIPKALLDAVKQASASCPECAEIIRDTFQMALDDGEPLHRSNADAPIRRPGRVASTAASDSVPAEWGVPAAPMPDFSMMMSAPMAASARMAREDVEANPPRAHIYRIGASTLTLMPGDLTRSLAEVVVSSDDDTLAMGGGVSRALRRASGGLLREEAERVLATTNPSVGDVVVTGAPGLPARFVFHAITLRNIGGRRQPVVIDGSVGAVVRLCVHGAFDLVDSLRIQSIAFPVIAAGSARVPYATAMHEMADAIVSRLLATAAPVSVEVYLHDRYGRYSDGELVADFARHVAQRRELTLQNEGAAVRVRSWADEPETQTLVRETRPASVSHPTGSAAKALPEPRRLQTLVRTLVRLDSRRAELERSQVRAIVGKEVTEPGQLETLSRLLATLRSRRGATEDLIVSPPPPSDPRAVFVSSSWTDLRDHRASIRNVLASRGMEFVGMEEILTMPSIPRDATLAYIGRAGTYIAVVGWRYGSVDEASGLSFTELEYVHAVGQGKPVLAFLADESVAVRPSDRDPDGHQRLIAFRETLALRHGAVTFSDPADLALKVTQALG